MKCSKSLIHARRGPGTLLFGRGPRVKRDSPYSRTLERHISRVSQENLP
jgi:hypothetical protein